MRTNLDFSPMFRSSIGFDRMLSALQAGIDTVDNWPPYDIIKTGEDAYRIEMAVAGFSQDELLMTQEQNLLVVAGRKADSDDDVQYLHRSVAQRSFQRRFELADHVKVESAELVDGLLIIDLKREIPEEMKPRQIEIGTGQALPKFETKQIEAETQAA
ncbi:Hsp20 family protein [Rhizobium leguminosarum]|uniref:Hsp20 family protein n=1 Tax=Rhizobium leguminosarum TaxID=384 RepID=UPI0003609B58|nr:Hsp20 family protein [Rhizobium leguminosarum]RWY68701.1 Hsp20 family protein [Rhizobium leguminosarum]